MGKGLVNFTKQSINELKKIEWPKRSETVKLTGYVIGISLCVGLLIMLFDYIFKELLTLILTN
ncbi:preprotein translocase subunit SecE [Patescibacteria group bacterium]